MKKTINKRVYNTDTAILICTKSFGEFGDAQGYEEKLYQTKKGAFFIYGVGGQESKYDKETIVAITDEEASAIQGE